MARSGKWPVGAAQVGGAAQRDGRRRALLCVVLRVGKKGGGGRRRKGKEGEKEKRKRKKGKKEKKRERGKERERSARFAAAVGHARCDARPIEDVHAEREKERRDRDWY